MDINLNFPPKVIFGIFAEATLFKSVVLKITFFVLERVEKVIEM